MGLDYSFCLQIVIDATNFTIVYYFTKMYYACMNRKEIVWKIKELLKLRKLFIKL